MSRKKDKVIKICQFCNNPFNVSVYRVKIGKDKYCSQKCYGKSRRGIIPKTAFKKGHLCNYKHGRIITEHGYIRIFAPDHPYSNICGYIKEHRIIVEKIIGRYLLRYEPVHHIGIKYPISSIENKQHNVPENLMCFYTESAHQRFHRSPHTVNSNEIIFDGRILS